MVLGRRVNVCRGSKSCLSVCNGGCHSEHRGFVVIAAVGVSELGRTNIVHIVHMLFKSCWVL